MLAIRKGLQCELEIFAVETLQPALRQLRSQMHHDIMNVPLDQEINAPLDQKADSRSISSDSFEKQFLVSCEESYVHEPSWPDRSMGIHQAGNMIASTRRSLLKDAASDPSRAPEVKHHGGRVSIRSSNAPVESERMRLVDSQTDVEEWMDLVPQENIADIMGFGTQASNNDVISLRLRNLMISLVDHPLFDRLASVCVFLNAMAIGMETSYLATHIGDGTPPLFVLLSNVFCALSVMELSARLCVHGKSFWTSADWHWNWFDTICIVPQIIESGMTMWTASESMTSPNMGFFRSLRIIRFLRIARVFRLIHLLTELRTMFSSVVSSFVYLFWACIMFVVLIFIVGVFFTQAVTDWRSFDKDQAVRQPEVEQTLVKYYGSLGRTMLYLWASISGGVDWADMLEPLVSEVSAFGGVVFMCYVIISVLAMMNVITGIFVTRAIETAEGDQNMYVAKHVIEVFQNSELDAEGNITIESFQSMIQSEELQNLFHMVDVDETDAMRLFLLMDVDDKKAVDPIALMNSWVRLRGPAKSLDLALLMSETGLANRALQKVLGKVVDKLDTLAEKLGHRAKEGASGGREPARIQLSTPNRTDMLHMARRSRSLSSTNHRQSLLQPGA